MRMMTQVVQEKAWWLTSNRDQWSDTKNKTVNINQTKIPQNTQM